MNEEEFQREQRKQLMAFLKRWGKELPDDKIDQILIRINEIDHNILTTNTPDKEQNRTEE